MISDVLSRLEKVRQTGKETWIACCPSHDDKSPSLTLRDDGGKVLLHCFAGCEPLSVLGAIGLEMSDLFPDKAIAHKPERSLRKSFPAADVLEALAGESLVVLIAANDIRNGKVPTDEDMKRLSVAIGRIEEGRRLANG